jgi:lipoprotein signal peptidase
LGGLLVPRLRAVWLLWSAAAVQVLASMSGLRLAVIVCAVVLVWIALNAAVAVGRVRLGLLVVLAGAVANTVPIAMNERMPYAESAAVVAGLDPGGSTGKSVPATAGSSVSWLGDVIHVPFLHAVISVGDVALAVGVAMLVAALMLAPRPERDHRTPRNDASTPSAQ